MRLRALSALPVIASLATCAGAPGQRTHRVAEVTVRATKTARIWRGKVDRALAAGAGIAAPGGIAAQTPVEGPVGRAAQREARRGRLQRMADRLIVRTDGGPVPAHLAIRVPNVQFASSTQVRGLNGNHHRPAAVQLLEVWTGAPLSTRHVARGEAKGGTSPAGRPVDGLGGRAPGRVVPGFVRDRNGWPRGSRLVGTAWDARPATVPPMPAPPVASSHPRA